MRASISRSVFLALRSSFSSSAVAAAAYCAGGVDARDVARGEAAADCLAAFGTELTRCSESSLSEPLERTESSLF